MSPRHLRLLAPAAAIAAVATLSLAPTATTALTKASASDRAGGETTRCAKPTEQEPDSSQKYELTSGDLERSYVLRLPDGYDRRDDWPLIVAFHGRGSTGVEVEGYSELSDLPAVVAYPDGAIGTGSGYRKAWQGAPYEAPGVDDVAFTRDLLAAIEADHCIDTSRVYATGKSNGGGLTALLACQLPGTFAAIAPVAPALYPGARVGCEEAPPTPILEIHGVADATIPYAGDADRDLPAIPEWVEGWAEHNGCATTTTRTNRDVATTRWTGCAQGAEVQHVAVDGGGHVWPGGDIYSGGGHVTHTIESATVIWDFFSRHRLTSEG
ncbi:prolyl oligopeptidase family serine peptidase [Nocardioides sp. KC13]|uniref:Prolyl oligopeptidase family serine peptidase n=1 Tax=Nocardioides turkmenicus TaxID=2711220 RepID=A0A6M1QNF1_9ACTN|nr:PHB depolymerase family esterase [Nocardioides sp. KC13]NGN91165.1 prolyl oligopeptidase family serine peptidase [Nocardioides sp. KC13]